MKTILLWACALGLAAPFSRAQIPASPTPAPEAAPPPATAALSDNYETPPIFQASKVLPASLLVGPHHRVREQAPSDGYLMHFTIDSDFGIFPCTGRRQVAQRIGEIAAIAKLVEVSKGDLFAEGLKRSIEQPIDAVKNIAHHPKESLKQAPKTVGHFFRKVGTSIGNAAKHVEKSIVDAQGNGYSAEEAKAAGREIGNAAKNVAGFDLAKLDTARQLGVDPYSNNPRLQEEMEKVTWAFFAGGLPLRVAAATVSGGASVALTTTKTVGLPEEVYKLTSSELALRDREALQTMGTPPATIDRIFLNRALTTSLCHAIVERIRAFPNTPKKLDVVDVAAGCETIDQVRFLNDALTLLATRHEAAPYTTLTALGRLPAGVTPEGVVEVAAPVDFISWTSQVAHFAQRDDLAQSPHRLILAPAAGISPTAQSKIKAADWEVVTPR